jgi:hypothetical protein
MTFSVDTSGLAGMPAQLDRLEQDARAGVQYVERYTRLTYGGLLNGITGSHGHAVGAVRDYLETLSGPVAGNTAQAVRVAATYYDMTDANSAAKLDATYRIEGGDGESGTGTVDYTAISVPSFTDAAEPTDRYQPPPDRSEEFAYEPKPVALISPAAAGRMLIVEATTLAAKLGLGHRWDPYESILKPITGDWNGLRGCTDVFDHVAEAVGDMCVNLRGCANSVPGVWTGGAADGLREHLLAVADSLEEAREPIKRLAEAYETAADGAHELFASLGDILNDLIDAVIIFIAEASAAVATSETVVGGIAFGAAAAFEAYECYKLIRELIECYTLADAIMEALQSSLNGFGVVDGNVRLPELDRTRPPLPGDQASVGRPSVTAAPTPPADGHPQPIQPPDPHPTPAPGPTAVPTPSPQPAPVASGG